MPFPVMKPRIGEMIDLSLAVWSVTTAFFTIGLCKNTPPQSDTLVPGDMVEPDGSWYAQEDAIVQGEKYIGPDGLWRITIPGFQFNYTGTDPSEDIYGWFILANSGHLLCCNLLPAPVPMGSTENSVVVPDTTLVFPRPYVE